MSELTIRPTVKFIRAGFVLAALVFAGLEVLFWTQWSGGSPQWLAALPLLIFLWPAQRWMRRRFDTTTVAGDRLRYESGIASRSTRTIQLSRIQDVRVDQTVMQRVFNVGNLSIETAGETSRLTLFNIDQPQRLADEIMNRVQGAAASS